jgi:hypothetical protein
MTHKYGAKPVWYHPIGDKAVPTLAITAKEAKAQGWFYFSSTLEYETFRNVRAFMSQKRLNWSLETQHTIEILPKTDIFKAITWCVDLKLDYHHPKHADYQGILYIEAKGIEHADYTLKVNLLSRFKPDILRGLVVIRNSRNVSSTLEGYLRRKHG